VDEELKKIEQGFAVIRTQMSFTFDGSGFKLVGDQASPGPDMVYGTDGSGVKGWKAGSGGGGGSGPQGVPGRPGYDGIDGEDSYIPGPQGPAGAAGAAGARGIDGRPGFDGLDGEDSYIPGPQGPAGPQGPQGLSGASGSPGAPGLDGNDGEDGRPGPEGPRGLDGAAGAQGLPGPALVYLLDPPEPDVILIPGPQGPKGDTGASGGGGGGGTWGTTTVDFGAFPGSRDTTRVVTGLGAITGGSIVNAWLYPVATADHSADEHVVEKIAISVSDIVAATGFTIRAVHTNEIHEPTNTPEDLRSQIAGRPVGGPGVSRATAPVPSGQATRLYGLWTVAYNGNF
jgi:hypothetical protein